MYRTRIRLSMLILLLCSAWIAVSALDALGGEFKDDNHIMAKGYFIREAEDQDWAFNISGEVVSMCGIYVIVYDVNKKVIYHGMVPCGKYSLDDPYVIKIKKDGLIGDYKIKIIAAQSDFMSLNLPMTDLKEVYEVQRTTIGHAKDRYLLFQVSPEQTELIIYAYKGQLQVKEDNTRKVVVDTSRGQYGGDASKSKYRFSNYVTFKVIPDVVYRIEPNAFYFGFGDTIYTMFKPDGWFFPNQKLAEIKWWKLHFK